MKRALALTLAVIVACTTGCPGKSTGRRGGNVPNPPNPAPGPVPPTNPNSGQVDQTKDHTGHVKAVLVTGVPNTAVLGFKFLGDPFDAGNPSANGKLPPPNRRFLATWTFNNPSNVRTTVTRELSTGTPPTLEVSTQQIALHPSNPDIRFKLELLGTPAPPPGTVTQVLIPETSITATTADVGYSLGFDGP